MHVCQTTPQVLAKPMAEEGCTDARLPNHSTGTSRNRWRRRAAPMHTNCGGEMHQCTFAKPLYWYFAKPMV